MEKAARMEDHPLISFSYVNGKGPPSPTDGLTLAIRTDARHATTGLKKNLLSHLTKENRSDLFNLAAKQTGKDKSLDAYVQRVVHNAYQQWGHESLGLLAECIDYEKYNLLDPQEHHIQVHFYNAQDLEQKVTHIAKTFGKKDSLPPPFLISLDDMITGTGNHWSEIGFSRLFSICGNEQYGYVGRPGKDSIETQLGNLREKLNTLHEQYGTEVPVVLLEDNVRHAKMMNWFIDLAEDHNVFENAKLAGIATCFCSAAPEELAKIKFRSNNVPVKAIVNYTGRTVDVMTPRDLLFDGLVVKVDEELGRLPCIFMDVEKHFKIRTDKTGEFQSRISAINAGFCENLEKEFGIDIPVSWFDSAKPIACVTKHDQDASMKHIMTKHTRPSL